MLGENVINSIKGYIKGRNSSVKKLGKVNKKLNDSLESSPNISKIKEAFQKELFGVLKPNHISVNAKLFDVIKNIGENLEQIKKEPVLGRRIKDIEFNTNAIEVNGITIDCTEKPSHRDPADTQNSINEIEKSYQILTELERIIPKLEKRFKDNIRILSNIRDKQKIFSDTSRESNENDEKLGEITSLKEQLQINPITIQGRFLPFGDDETVAKVGDDSETTDGYIKDFQNHLTQLNNFKKEVKNIHKRYKKNKDNLEKIMELQKFHERINNGDDIKEYQGKLDAMVDICKNVLLLDGEAKTKEIEDQTIDLGGSLSPIPLNFVHGLSSDRTATYSLSSPEGRDADGKDIKLRKVEGVNFDQKSQSLLVNDIMIDPTDLIKFPVDLCLNIGVDIYDEKTGLTVKHEKPVILTINTPKLSSDDRKEVYDSIIPSMDAKISNIYTDKYREDLENEIILNILKGGLDKNGVKDLDKNDAKKNKLISNIRNRLKAHIPFLKLDDLQKGFKEDITDKFTHIPYKHLANKDSFKKYVETNLDNLLKNYAHYKIYKKVSKYHDDIILGTYGRNSISKRRKKSESNFNNYTALLKGKESSEFKTKNGNALKIEVKGIDKIIATITINDTQEEIDVVNHDKAIEYILNKTTARDGTTLGKEEACRLAMCVLKAMTQISPKKLSKYGKVLNHAECNMSEIILYGPDNNLRYLGGDMDTNKDVQYVTIFDESDMDGIDRSNQDAVNAMEDKIRMVSTQINTILNSFAKDYQKGLDKKLLRYNPSKRLQKGSIKRLFGKDKGINYDFTDVKVPDLGKKDITISFEKGKFIVTGEFEGQEYRYEAKNLGLILRKEINKKRVFAGVELEIINKVNEEYVKQLGTNDSINCESFAIADLHENNTGRIYIYDSAAGDLSYIEVGHERHNPLKNVSSGRIDPNDIAAITKHKCNDEEKKEFFQNPLLAGRLIREMEKTSRLLSFNKISASKIARSRRKAVLKKMGWKRRLRLSTEKIKQKFKGSWIGKLSSKAINSLSNKFPKLFENDKVSRTEKNKAKMINKNKSI